MCALQDCTSTPLLSRKNMSAAMNFPSKEPSILCPDPAIPSFMEQCYTASFPENELFSHASEIPLENNMALAYDEKPHFQSKNVFQASKSCRSTYSELNPMPGEIDHLLREEYTDASNFAREAEYLPPSLSKKPFSKRSASDFSISKKYDEMKLAPSCDASCDSKQNFKSSIHPLSDAQNLKHYVASADNYLLNNCSCYASNDVVPEVPTGKRNSLPMDCEASSSGLYQNIFDDSRSSDDKNFYKGYNLNPTVNLKIFDTESLSESGDQNNTTELNNQRMVDETWFITSSRNAFSTTELSGSASAAQLSIASSFGDSNTPTCKICHMPAKGDDPLISPCRCTGTLHYIHCGCLMRWLEICNKRSRKPPACELCKYQFHWHKKFKVRHWQFPNCSWKDKILHTVFLLSILVMIGCAVVTVMCFRQHRGNKQDFTQLELTQSEIITLICGALFFLAFFLAMYVEIKARNTIYKLLVKFIYLNQQWYIDEYDKKGENTVIDV